MGRYYWGDIEGKFWFGVQSSSDVENLLNITSQPGSLVWHGCGCAVDFDQKNDEYCKDCYESKEDFLDEMGEDFEGDPYDELPEIVYNIEEDDLEDLCDALTKLEKEIDPRIVSEYKKIDGDMSNAFSGVFKQVDELVGIILKEKENMDLQVIARYGLGLQIKQCLEKNGSCGLYCEL